MSVQASAAIQAGPRLDRLPVGRFHWRMLALIGSGMFLDGFEIYLAGSVLGVLVKDGWSNLQLNAHFISATFVGMVIGTWLAGVLGDRFGRRFSYQFNLLLFGLASLAGALAPSMTWLIVARLFMGIGLGAEIVVGYVTLAEFVPPKMRGRWLSGLAIVTNSALFISSLVGYLIIPSLGWRAMFVIAGIGALIVWYLRKRMPESPRWLESQGRLEEAERALQAIEAEVSRGQPLPPVITEAPIAAPGKVRSIGAVFSRQFVGSTVVGSVICIAISIGVYGLVVWLPTFFVKQGYSIASSLGFTTLMSLGGPAGALLGYFIADRIGRRASLIGTSLAAIVLSVAYPYAHDAVLFVIIGFALVSSIYLLIAIGWALYIPELFPTDLRMRGTGVCNTAGRLMTIVTPYIVITAFGLYGISGVLVLVIGIMLLVCALVYTLGTETTRRPLEVVTAAGPHDANLVRQPAVGSLRTAPTENI
jgi:MFS transporter, putative metabolite:H+ symporter